MHEKGRRNFGGVSQEALCIVCVTWCLATGAILRAGVWFCFLRFPNQKLPDTG